MPRPLNGQTAVITGASSGIGAATARALAAAGANVVLGARNPDKLDALIKDIQDTGGQATARPTDITDLDDVKALFAHAADTFGHIRGYLNAISAALPTMLDRGTGHILNMSSVAGIRVGDSSGVYSATKFFIRGITDSLRQEIGVERGIRISMISPGVIDTGWADKVNDAQARDTAQALNADAIPPERIADSVLWALTQPPEVTVNDIVIHPTKQAW